MDRVAPVQRIAITLSALVLGAGLAFGVVACGGDDDKTTTETQTETQATQAQTTTQGGGGGGGTTTTSDPVANCTSQQVYSQTSKTCVDIRQGNNPCPQGEVPMADQPVCVPKN
jgi:hypothetical protein